jgi:rsbT co-antagonist protein RsbR
MEPRDERDGRESEIILEHIIDVLMVLSEVTSNDFSGRLETTLPDDHPISALYKGINETVASLATAQERMLSYQRELEEKLDTIARQRAAISELSTPVIEIWNGVLCMPFVGVMDTARGAEMTEAILRATIEKNARCTIIDITGIEVMDTGTADHLIRVAKAIRLLGARCVVTGISPTIAQTIIHMGVQLDGVITRRSLRDALQDVVRSEFLEASGLAGEDKTEPEGKPDAKGTRSAADDRNGAHKR